MSFHLLTPPLPFPSSGPAPSIANCQINAGSMFPITACQFGMNRFLEQKYSQYYDAVLDDRSKIGVAMAAGSASAFLGCPAEYVVIQQQRHCRPLGAELKHIFTERGPLALYRGLVRLNPLTFFSSVYPPSLTCAMFLRF